MPRLRFFYVTNVSFNSIRENKILAKISEFTVDEDGPYLGRPTPLESCASMFKD